MKTLKLLNYAADQWVAGDGGLAEVHSAVTGDVIAETGSNGLDFKAMLDHARNVGGPALRAMTFHERAWMLKDLANAIMARKEELYELNYATGATRTDGWIDIEGGAGTLFSFSSKGRRELPNGRILIDGAMEPLSKGGSFVGQHVFTPLQGVAVQPARIIVLILARPAVGAEAKRVASASTSASSVSSSTAFQIIPHKAAFSAESASPVSASPIARAWPIRRGSTHVPPLSGTSPIFAKD